MSISPESDRDLSNFMHEKAMDVLIHEGMDYLEQTIAPNSETLEEFKSKIALLSPEGQKALIGLRELYLRDEATARTTQKFIENFLRLYHVGNEKVSSNFSSKASEASHQVANPSRFGFFAHNKKENSANKLYELGQEAYRKKEYSKAVDYYQHAAEKGHGRALVNLGFCYHLGQGVAVDNQQAISCFEQAARSKDPKALFSLGLAYHEGWQNGEPDHEKALEYFVDSAVLNYGDAISQLGWYAENGYGGLKQDLQEGYRHYVKAEQSGSLDGCYNAGRCHEYGKGVSEDLNMALTYYKRASMKGHEDAKDAVERIEHKLQANLGEPLPEVRPGM